MRVAVVGAGRIGRLVAERLGPEVRKVIIDNDPQRADLTARTSGGVGGRSLADAAEADVVILAIPAGEVSAVVRTLSGLLRSGTLVLDLATGSGSVAAGLQVVPVKIIGHAREIAAGVAPLLVAETADDRLLELIRELLRRFGPVVRGSEKLASLTNTIASEEAVRAALALQRRLRAAGVPEDWLQAAVGGPAAGTMKALIAGDIGPFLQGLVTRLGVGDAKQPPALQTGDEI